METTQLKVTGMTCGMCVQHVTQALQSVPGVKQATVDLTSGNTIVNHDPTAKPEAMIEAVSEAGYEAKLTP